MKKEDKLYELIQPQVELLNYECVDVTFEKRSKDFVLTIYIDHEGNIGLDDCEKVSLAIEAYLDETDPIEQPYVLEVSSPGLGRPLKRPRDFEKALNQQVEVNCFMPINGVKQMSGKLVSYDDETVRIQTENDEIELSLKAISRIAPEIEF